MSIALYGHDLDVDPFSAETTIVDLLAMDARSVSLDVLDNLESRT